MTSDLPHLLRTLRVWAPEATRLPAFDPDTAPATPLPLFTDWFAEAVAAGEREPHTMSLATTDADGTPDVRIVMLHGADERHGWSFATHSTSRKGRHLAERPYAALAFYWPSLGRQVRVRGRVTAAPDTESQADLHARSTGALAAALTGRQSQVLPSLDELAAASEEAWERAVRNPEAPSPTWTLYQLAPDAVEFFQGDERRRHVRLEYRRSEGSWEKALLWP
ncbi:pyridoxal 5'-phosphate synthase [Streptomyces niveiscabiei]|uniref:pyridoxine/pyridoxamine 5'-phosphate oxidase n=1 Tax=Streptomyces niveiscabiei TaxID=164115 RepID=UPI0029AEC61C|nr:pyridoxal 5'-phosphate synthase [Streptomyces niveiscabiei]MDX3385469.1 pyridoxal 5'-phosphate synthase [Streptomyces niveiscabiei]